MCEGARLREGRDRDLEDGFRRGEDWGRSVAQRQRQQPLTQPMRKLRLGSVPLLDASTSLGSKMFARISQKSIRLQVVGVSARQFGAKSAS